MTTTQSVRHKVRSIDRSEYESEVQPMFDTWVARLDEIDALRGLSDHFIIKGMIELYRGQIEDIDTLLKTKKSDALSDKERDNLIDRKKLYTDFINSFDPDAQLASLEQQVDQYYVSDDKIHA